VGLVSLRAAGDRLAFAAPPLLRSGPVDEATLARVVSALGLPGTAVRDAAWVDNGPGWVGLLLDGADRVLGLEPDFGALRGLEVGVIGAYDDGPADFEVRAFCPDLAITEDPVTGSLNAGLAVADRGRPGAAGVLGPAGHPAPPRGGRRGHHRRRRHLGRWCVPDRHQRHR
jgi:predicted PhzF superfamily epimerase YddE/YHI9